MKKLIGSSLFFCLVMAFLPAPNVTAEVINGGFESGLSSWVYTGEVNVVGSTTVTNPPYFNYTVAPKIGSQMAQLTGDSTDSSLSQTFFASGKMDISFWYNMFAYDYEGGVAVREPDGPDYFKVKIDGVLVLDREIDAEVNKLLTTDWDYFTININFAPGTHTLEFINDTVYSNGNLDPTLTTYIDGEGVSVTPVPEPGTMLLLGSGLMGLVGYGRRRFKK